MFKPMRIVGIFNASSNCNSHHWRSVGYTRFVVLCLCNTIDIANFPGASDEAIHVGIIMRRGLAAMSFLAGLVIFLIRK